MKLFKNGNHQVIWGDAQAALDEFVDDHSVDLVFADPPYNIGKNFNGNKERWNSDEAYLGMVLHMAGIVHSEDQTLRQFLCDDGYAKHALFLDLFLRKRMHVISRIVWSYDSSGVQAKKHFGSLYEPILFCVKDKKNYTFNSSDILVEAKTGARRKLIDYRKPTPQRYNDKKVPGNVWAFPRVRYRMEEYENHPTQKPVALLERIIKASSNPGDLILDPFSGTFTTSFVAKKLGRKSIGIEKDNSYMQTGLRRLQIRTTYEGKKVAKRTKIFRTRESPRQ